MRFKDEEQKRPRVPETIFEEVQDEDEEKPFHENLAEKLGLTEEDSLL
jgi:hypothetical protein